MARKRNFRAISVTAAPMKGCKTRKLTEKILKEAFAQQREVEDEENAETLPMNAFFKQALHESEDVIDDVDEDEFHSHLDYQDMFCTEEEEKLLQDAFFHKDGASIAKRLSHTITSSRKELEDKDVASPGSASVSDHFRKLGEFMSVYTQGKMPKALNYVTRLQNWESLLRLTQPENWSPNAMFKATNMFASSSKAKRFYELFLLPRVREDIRVNKKLHFSLYQSLKKALFKPDGFYSGIIFPLCQSRTCTIREALIMGSIIKQCSIPEKFSSPALVCLAELEFSATTSYFMKVILEKKYALTHLAIDAVVTHFLRFHKETKVMPVIWHQTLLAFMQLYKHEIRKEDKESLTSLLEKQNHECITREIVRELESSRSRGEKENDLHSASMINNKLIKEDWFDMPQVPMED